MLVFPRREAIYLKFISLESLLAITHVALLINMHEIKKITFISHTMCIDFLQNEM